MGVTPRDRLQERLKWLHRYQGLSWRKIAALPEFAGIPAGTLCSFAKGKRPIPHKYLARLGLPLPSVLVTPVRGATIPPGTQVAGARRCIRCGAPFAPTHPRRIYCFECHPPRGKKGASNEPSIR